MLLKDTEQKVYTISELNQSVRDRLEKEFAQIWVEGEISNLARPSSGHIYFTLKDNRAQIRCAMFASRRHSVGFEFENGLHVLVKAKASLYETRGEFQLIIEWAEMAGEGKLQKAFEALKNKLSEEGLFDPLHKKPIPSFPKAIGVITSPTGAAIRDILNVLKRRFPHIPVIIYPTLVQGQLAAAQITEAIRKANAHQICEVLMLARGGGSLEDLWPFNEEIVARAVFASEIPIVSAVGHEIDFTIADFAADLRAPTPSAGAELISPDQLEWQLALQQREKHLTHLMNKQLQQDKKTLEHLGKRLRHPKETLQNRMQYLDQLEQTLLRVQANLLSQKKFCLTALSQKVDALSPLKTLSRGYAFVSGLDGHIISSVQSVSVGDVIQTRFADGKLTSIVQNIN